MIKKIWYFFILISAIFGIFNGKITDMANTFSSSGQDAVKISLSLIGTICFWSGLMEIVEESRLTDKINIIFRPIINMLFKDIKNNKEASNAVILNLSANFLGLGNAATPLGIDAIHKMNKINNKKDTLSDDMIMFLVLNTTCLQLLPTSIFAYRMSFGSKNPTIVFLPILLSTLCTTICGILLVKLFNRGKKC